MYMYIYIYILYIYIYIALDESLVTNIALDFASAKPHQELYILYKQSAVF